MFLHSLIVLWLAACAIFDLRNRHVPNILTLPLFFLGAGYTLVTRGESLVRFLLVFSVLFMA